MNLIVGVSGGRGMKIEEIWEECKCLLRQWPLVDGIWLPVWPLVEHTIFG